MSFAHDPRAIHTFGKMGRGLVEIHSLVWEEEDLDRSEIACIQLCRFSLTALDHNI